MLLLLLVSLTAAAVLARPCWQWMTLENGTRVEVMLVGDECLHYYITRDSVALLPDGNGYLVPASQQQLAALKRRGLERKGDRLSSTRSLSSARRRVYQFGDNNYQGDFRQLVLLVSFPDQSFKEEEPVVLWNRIFNEEGFQEEPFVGSVHDYFSDQSYGQFRLTFDLYAVEAPHGYKTYGGTDRNGDDDQAGRLLADAIALMKDQVRDWSVYDWNGDGSIDQVLYVFAGKAQNDGGDASTIWSQTWTLTDEGVGQTVVESNGHEYLVDLFSCVGEQDRLGGYGTFGTICHEYSHCLGLPDFYSGNVSVVGDWDLMDSGNYNGYGFCPAGYSAHERMVMGWLSPTELQAQTTVQGMTALHDAPEAYLIRNSGYADEYYMIENRQPSRWDASLPSSGLLVAHVDYDETSWLVGVPNENRNRPRYSLFAADNRTVSSWRNNWTYPYAGNDSLTDRSQPAATVYHATADNTYCMGKPITGMSVTDGVASFRFMDGVPVSIAIPRQVDEPVLGVYDLHGRYCGQTVDILPQGIYVVRRGNQVRKEVKGR